MQMFSFLRNKDANETDCRGIKNTDEPDVEGPIFEDNPSQINLSNNAGGDITNHSSSITTRTGNDKKHSCSVSFVTGASDAGKHSHSTSATKGRSDTISQNQMIEYVDIPLDRFDRGTNQGRMSMLEKAHDSALIRKLIRFRKKTEEEEGNMCHSFSSNYKIISLLIVLPCFISVWYSAAMLFPPEARKKFHLLLWTEGALRFQKKDNGNDSQPVICPHASICSEGAFQIILISIARVTAFAMYTFMGLTFISKMHCLNSFLSKSYLRTWIPFAAFHHVHKKNATIFTSLAFIHGIAHYARYILRRDADQLMTQVHISGLFGLLAILLTVLSMSTIVKKYEKIKYETRFNCHWIAMIGLVFSLCFHHGRTAIIVCIFL